MLRTVNPKFISAHCVHFTSHIGTKFKNYCTLKCISIGRGFHIFSQR